MSRYLWLIRHGESQGNLERRVQGWADYPLTDLGRWQAARLAERLAQEGAIHELVASPLQRAAETAQIISRALDLPVRFDARLKEYNFGPLTGLTPDDIVARFPSVQAAWEVNQVWKPLAGEEGDPTFVGRVRAVMDEIVAGMDEGANVAVVAHGGSLDACLRSWLGIAYRSPLGNGNNGRRAFAFDNASVSLVRIRAGSYRVLLLNDTCHLRGADEDWRNNPVK
jgi:broad specificity phosphatase PhoE